MGIENGELTNEQVKRLLGLEEGQFIDFKAKAIKPVKLSKHLSAFSNADGGELYIGIDEEGTAKNKIWNGFIDHEAANGHIQALETFFPLGEDYSYTFLSNKSEKGYILLIAAGKTREIKKAADGIVYLRRGAQSLPQTRSEEIERLKFNKGIASFETETLSIDKEIITDSLAIVEFMVDVIPTSDPEAWAKKQQILRNEKPTVAGVILFADEPQASLPKRCGVKIYRYKTDAEQGTRETLAFNPITIEGHAYSQIKNAVSNTVNIVQSLNVIGPDGPEKAKYPPEALHEVLTNAVLHRDYSITDDIHIRIFENRIEVESPGKLPGHITVENILDQRFARNGTLVRLLNKYPDAPNKDVGEGLNTTFQAMRKLDLKEPSIVEKENSVLVVLRHEPIAPPEELVLDYLKKHGSINNTVARKITYIGSENKVKRVFERLMKSGQIERIPNLKGKATAYRMIE